MADKYTNKELNDWFIGKARTAAGYRKNIISNHERGRDNTVIGRMYFFMYDPKHKEKLPIYDRFPLVFPIERYPDGFLGLNLHYLGQSERAALLNRLLEYRGNSKITEATRLKLSYDLISSTKNIKGLASNCIKRYLFDHVRSKFIEVTANEWDKAIQLPVELFVTKR